MAPHRPSFRFSPPRVEIGPEMSWVLFRAFGHAGVPASATPKAGEAVRLAERLGLAARIASRLSPGTLLEELDEPSTARLLYHRTTATAIGLILRRTADAVAGVAAEMQAPILFLKGLALHLSGSTPPESRPCADLDLLSRSQDAARLRQTLADRGFRPHGGAANPQHLAPLFSPHDLGIDIHYRLRGVDLGAGWATADDLLESGDCLPLKDFPGECYVPSPRLLSAHALVHGIEQHGLRPAGYPLLRMVGDLCDLLPDEVSWDRFLRQGSSWIAGTLEAEELAAARELCLTLARGCLPSLSSGEGDAGGRRLLDHFLQGSLDPNYARSLRLAHTLSRLRSARSQGGLLRYISSKLFVDDSRPTGGDVETGQERRSFANRVGRPLALLSAALKARWGWRKQKRSDDGEGAGA